MSLSKDLPLLKEQIERQLRYNIPEINNDELILLNLNKTTASTHVPDVFQWMSEDEHWEGCEGCPAFANCPIRHNAGNIEKNDIQQRIKRLYQILEHFGYHLTIRDMLMHLSYVVTGGLSCSEVINPLRPDEWKEESLRYTYHENIWGQMATERLRHKVLAIRYLRRLNPGKVSIFDIDRQIMDEDPTTEYEKIFLNTPDLGRQFYQQSKSAYRRGMDSSNLQEPSKIISQWLPHYRRKIFIELPDERKAMQLLPFIYISDYFEVLEGSRSKRASIRKQFIRGLNRAFSNLYISEDEHLYVTAQYAHSAEQPIPIVKLKVPSANINLKSISEDTEAFDREFQKLELEIFLPAYLQEGNQSETWHVNLLTFEYLLRRGNGGTANILADECGLTIRRLKDRLLTRVSSADYSDQEEVIKFFAVRDNQYKIQELIIEQGI